jgi:hypothetical protein
MATENRRDDVNPELSGSPPELTTHVDATREGEPRPSEATSSSPVAASRTMPPRRWRRWVGLGVAGAVVLVVAAGGTAAWARSHRNGAFGFARSAPRGDVMRPGRESSGAWGFQGDQRGGRDGRPQSGPRWEGPMPRQPRFGPETGPREMPGPWGQPPMAAPAPGAPPNPAQSQAPTVAPAMGTLSQGQLGRVATALGIPAADLERDVRAGKTLAMIGQERGKTRDEVRSAVIDAIIDAR